MEGGQTAAAADAAYVDEFETVTSVAADDDFEKIELAFSSLWIVTE